MFRAVSRRCLCAATMATSTGSPVPYANRDGAVVNNAKLSAALAARRERSQFTQPGLNGLRIVIQKPNNNNNKNNNNDHENEKNEGESSGSTTMAHNNMNNNSRNSMQLYAVGHVVAQLSEAVFAVDFRDSPPPFSIALGCRVYVAYTRDGVGAPPPSPSLSSSSSTPANSSKSGEEAAAAAANANLFLIGGLIVRINRNGTFGVLLDNNKIDLAVPHDKIHVTEGPGKFLLHPKYLEMVEWLKNSGLVEQKDEIEGTACILYQRGWRAERLYLLEAADVRNMTHLSKSARMSLMEKAEWQRDHHRQMRSIYKERVKEKDRRYLFSKYAGILSASVAFCGAFSLFGWNYKNYLKHQRSYQMRFAVTTLCRPVTTTAAAEEAEEMAKTSRLFPSSSSSSGTSHPSHSHGRDGGVPRAPRHIPRTVQEVWIQQIFRQLDTAHPRIVVLTGYFGCGKSSLCRKAIKKEGMIGAFVDVRNKEDALRSIIKALGVPHVEACGDPLDFISEACHKAKMAMGGRTPTIVLKLREGDNLARVYNEAVTLACDRRMCHVVIEVPLESLTLSSTNFPRLDFYTIPNFDRDQAYQYTQHRLDPLDMEYFLDTVGSNSNDLDELLAALHQRRVSPQEYTSQKLLKAMRQVQAAWRDNAHLKEIVQRVAQLPYEEGQHEGLDDDSLNHPSLSSIIFYNPVQDVWLFRNQVLHTAARCSL